MCGGVWGCECGPREGVRTMSSRCARASEMLKRESPFARLWAIHSSRASVA